MVPNCPILFLLSPSVTEEAPWAARISWKSLLSVLPSLSNALFQYVYSLFHCPHPQHERKSHIIQVLSHPSTFWVKHLQGKIPTYLFHADTDLKPNPRSHCGNKGPPFPVLPKFSSQEKGLGQEKKLILSPSYICLSCPVSFFLCVLGLSSRTNGTQLDGMADASVVNVHTESSASPQSKLWAPEGWPCSCLRNNLRHLKCYLGSLCWVYSWSRAFSHVASIFLLS